MSGSGDATGFGPSETYFDPHADGPAPEAQPSDEGAPFAGFRLLDTLGVGGMGVVWAARQRHPDRIVALKQMHPHLTSTLSVQRFRFEADALGRLQHPGIPQVYAVGREGDVLWIAMERIDGVTLMEWVRQHQPDLAARVLLLAAIADAVHHAHLRGLVHRDLKPANILVTADGQPKVLDFGVALSVDEKAHGVAGTLPYMSPEQLRGEPVDPRSDVYALALLGGELLTGSHPFPTVWTVQPPEPYPQVDAVAPDFPGLQGDLRAILVAALASDRDARTGSAAELASDLRAWLAHKPVSVVPPTWAYVSRLFLRRHPVPAALAAMLVGGLLVGATTTTVLYLDAAASRADAEAQAARAIAEAQKTRTSLDWLRSVFEQSDPGMVGGVGITVVEALRRSGGRLDDGELNGQPDVLFAARASLADALWSNGDFVAAAAESRKAVQLLESGSVRDHALAPVVLDKACERAWFTEPAHARPVCEHALGWVSEHAQPDDPNAVGVLLTVATMDADEGRWASADARFARIADVLRKVDHANAPGRDMLAKGLRRWARSLAIRGQIQPALVLVEEAIDADSQAWGADNARTATTLDAASEIARWGGDLDRAQAWADASLAIRERALEPSDWRRLSIAITRALITLRRGDLVGVSLAVDAFAPHLPHSASRTSFHGRLLHVIATSRRGEHARAEQDAERILDEAVRTVPPLVELTAPALAVRDAVRACRSGATPADAWSAGLVAIYGEETPLLTETRALVGAVCGEAAADR